MIEPTNPHQPKGTAAAVAILALVDIAFIAAGLATGLIVGSLVDKIVTALAWLFFGPIIGVAVLMAIGKILDKVKQ